VRAFDAFFDASQQVQRQGSDGPAPHALLPEHSPLPYDSIRPAAAMRAVDLQFRKNKGPAPT
jgi:hypothetical protein